MSYQHGWKYGTEVTSRTPSDPAWGRLLLWAEGRRGNLRQPKEPYISANANKSLGTIRKMYGCHSNCQAQLGGCFPPSSGAEQLGGDGDKPLYPKKPPWAGRARQDRGSFTSITLVRFGGAEPLLGGQRGFATSRDSLQWDGDHLVHGKPWD